MKVLEDTKRTLAALQNELEDVKRKPKMDEQRQSKKQGFNSIYLLTVLIIVSYMWLYGHVQQVSSASSYGVGEGEIISTTFPQPPLGLVQVYQENVESIDALESADDDMLPANEEVNGNGTKPICKIPTTLDKIFKILVLEDQVEKGLLRKGMRIY